MEDLKIIPVKGVASQGDCCFWTIHYSNFAEAVFSLECYPSINFLVEETPCAIKDYNLQIFRI